jgi:hypothetical protein
VSLVAAYPQVMELLSGRRPVGATAGFGLRWLREVVWAITLVGFGVWLTLGIPRHRWFWRGSALIASAIAGYAMFAYLRALWLGLPPQVPPTGLRLFQYVPYAWMAYHLARAHPIDFFVSIERILKVLLVVWTPIALYQVFNAPPVQGATAFGSRAFATFNEANVFGVTVATCALWMMLSRMLQGTAKPRVIVAHATWLGLCITLALLSGSRTAIGLTMVAIVLPMIWWLPRRIDRMVSASLVPLVLLATLVVSSSSAISGRRTNLLRDGRFEKWTSIVSEQLDSPVDLVFGWGLGLGSNTVNTLFGYGRYPGQFIADSQYLFLLGSYGLVGIAALGGLLVMLVAYAPRRPAITLATFVALFCVPFVAFELFPSNVLIMLAWGGLLGEKRHRQTSPGVAVRRA